MKSIKIFTVIILSLTALAVIFSLYSHYSLKKAIESQDDDCPCKQQKPITKMSYTKDEHADDTIEDVEDVEIEEVIQN